MESQVKVYQEKRYHYDFLRDDIKKTVQKLNASLGYYSFRFLKKSLETEVFYDTEDNMLSNAGVVISKVISEKGSYIQVRKVSYINLRTRKTDKKIIVTECTPKQSPKDFIVKVSAVVENIFANIFTIDLGEVINKISAKFEINIKGDVYQIAGGTGYRATLIFEKNIYKDLRTKKVVKKHGATLTTTIDPKFEKEREDLLYGIDRYCKELFPYNESRFEIACRVLRSKKELQEVAEERRVAEERAKKMAEEE